MTTQALPTNPDAIDRRTARIAGVFYLLVGIAGGFAEGFVEPKIYAPTGTMTTVENLVANASLVRLGVVADLLDQAFFVGLALTLYALLRHVHQSAARAMVGLVLVAAAIASLDVIFLFEGLQVATDPRYRDALGANGAEAIARLLVDVQHHGLLAAQVFFGLWLAPLGYLTLRSGRFTRPLGFVLILGAACYLVDVLTAFLAPSLASAIHGYVVIPCAVAEIWMVLYLLIFGIRARAFQGQT
ncbi:MAG: DUF4386 domain-containing protein [Devosia sp.]